MRGAPVLVSALLAAGAAVADPAQDAAAIRARLLGWAEAFNARDAGGVCEVFAADLISVVPDAPDAGKAAVCERLARLLEQDDRRFSYDADVEEVLVWGDHAAVRLTWTLEIAAGGETSRGVERGIDLFRRDPDGVWRIMRFIAFTDG
ncbi:MAG: nuclear transport factor 2 family protein [Rhodobacteraceae bacterium]|nr:nuclear transport factor 2 family protein [Paracoccaceae bacterium]